MYALKFRVFRYFGPGRISFLSKAPSFPCNPMFPAAKDANYYCSQLGKGIPRGNMPRAAGNHNQALVALCILGSCIVYIDRCVRT